MSVSENFLKQKLDVEFDYLKGVLGLFQERLQEVSIALNHLWFNLKDSHDLHSEELSNLLLGVVDCRVSANEWELKPLLPKVEWLENQIKPILERRKRDDDIRAA